MYDLLDLEKDLHYILTIKITSIKKYINEKKKHKLVVIELVCVFLLLRRSIMLTKNVYDTV